MISFILYEDEDQMRKIYKKVILRVMGPQNKSYHLNEFSYYDDEVESQLKSINGHKIYILDVEVPGKRGIDLAREIRNSGDWDSQIIMITSHEEYGTIGYMTKLLMLDFISKNVNIEKELENTLNVALNIIDNKKSLTFISDGEMHQVPHNDILYIEKMVNNNKCHIVTKGKTYLIRDTIDHLKDVFKDNYDFMKTHRSCIVNLKNITSVDLSRNIIFFENAQIDLIAKDKKSELKSRLQEDS